MADSSIAAISTTDLEEYTKEFLADRSNKLAMNAVTQNGCVSTALNYETLRTINYDDFNVRIENEGNPITSQKRTGRCWLFAFLNVLRTKFQEEKKIKAFEFSQAYLYFYDKLERLNYVLEMVIETAGDPIDDRVVQEILKNPMQDGGQYDMIKNVVAKHGVVPKSAYPESATTENSMKLRWVGNYKVRDWAMALRTKKAEGASTEDLWAMKKAFLKEWHSILCIFLGSPPIKFDWTYTDTDKKYFRFNGLTPMQFYKEHVVPTMKRELKEDISFIHDPRNAYFKPYSVDRLGNCVGGVDILYVNIPMDLMKQLTISSLRDRKEAVWFGCHFGEFLHREKSIMDTGIWDYEAMCGTTFKLNKEMRLRYGQTFMTHAMVFTGVDLDDGGKPLKWRVENSHGKDRGKDGYAYMSDAWFSEYMFQVVVNRKHLPEELGGVKVDDILSMKPENFPLWDPMGTLACN